MIGEGLDLGKTLSTSKNGIVTTGYNEDAIIKGQGFQIQRRITVPAGVGQTIYLILDTTDVINSGKIVFTMPISSKTTGGLVYMDTYKVTSYSGGTPVTPIQINGLSPVTPLTKFNIGATPVGSPGADLREYTVGYKSTNQASGGGSNNPDIFKIFPAGSIVTAKLTNQESDAVVVEFGLVFYEA